MADLWSEERTTECVQLWNQGHSASTVARMLGGVSRNAVIGKIHRLGLAHTKPLGRPVNKVRRAKSKVPRAPNRTWRAVERHPLHVMPSKPVLVQHALPPEPPRPAKLVSFADLEDNQCRFIYGDPKTADSGFCGCETAPGSSYCLGHHVKCVGAVQPRKLTPCVQNQPGHPKFKGELGYGQVKNTQEFLAKGAEEFIRA
jgi:GcrA cell cycle regulator